MKAQILRRAKISDGVATAFGGRLKPALVLHIDRRERHMAKDLAQMVAEAGGERLAGGAYDLGVVVE